MHDVSFAAKTLSRRGDFTPDGNLHGLSTLVTGLFLFVLQSFRSSCALYTYVHDDTHAKEEFDLVWGSTKQSICHDE